MRKQRGNGNILFSLKTLNNAAVGVAMSNPFQPRSNPNDRKAIIDSIDDAKTAIPRQEELAAVSRWACVAFGARTARRVQPLYDRWEGAGSEHTAAVDSAIRLVEDAASSAKPVDVFQATTALAKAISTALLFPNDALRITAGYAARSAAFACVAAAADVPGTYIALTRALRPDLVSTTFVRKAVDLTIAEHVATALCDARDAAHTVGEYEANKGVFLNPDRSLAVYARHVLPVYRGLRLDFDRLREYLEQIGGCTGTTPVPPTVFGPLIDPCKLEDAERRFEELERRGADPAEQLAAAESACRLARELHGEFSPAHVTWLGGVACRYVEAGDPEGALPRLRRCLELSLRVFGPTHPETAYAHNNLAYACRRLELCGEAEEHYCAAFEIDQDEYGPRHEETLADMTNLAICLLAKGTPEARVKAKKLLEHVRHVHTETLHPHDPRLAEDLRHRATILCDERAWPGAERDLRRALQLQEACPSLSPVQVAVTIVMLAGVLILRGGRVGKAIRLYERALQLCRQELGPNHPDVADTLNQLAFAHALRHFLSQDRKAWFARMSGWLRRLQSDRDAWSALDYMSQAAAIDDRMIGKIFAVTSEQQRLANLRTFHLAMGANLSLVFGEFLSSPAPVSRAFDLVLRRKGLAAEALAAQRDAILAGAYGHLKPQLKELANLRGRVARLIQDGPAPGGSDLHRRMLVQLDEERDRLEADLAQKVPEIRLQRVFQSVDGRTIAQALPKDSALVELVHLNVVDFKAVRAQGEAWYKPARYIAFVLPAGRAEQLQMIDLGEADPIDQLIADFRDYIAKPPWKRGDRGQPLIAVELRQRVFDPLVEALGNHTQLSIAPDGDLSLLPFEVLPLADGRLLIDNYKISYVACGRDVLRFDSAVTGRSTSSLVIANPDFDLGESSGRLPPPPATSKALSLRELLRQYEPFAPLRATRLEGERVAALIGAECWQGQSVLKTPLKQRLRSPRILHVATHGFFLKDDQPDPKKEDRETGLIGAWKQRFGSQLRNPLLRSGLTLAGVNTWVHEGKLPEEAADGLLTAEDVTGMDLLDTELVVLSACDTGLGQVHTGEGVFGLRRAFAVAGARTLVMSLWKVPDEQTQELMVDFYQRILGIGCVPQPRAEALRQAQQDLRKKHPDPYYWGAFICQGDPCPLSKPQLQEKQP
jgi:CHAT domain-containing protein/tetratricopeptide (TPR) repeat protein